MNCYDKDSLPFPAFKDRYENSLCDVNSFCNGMSMLSFP
jgi:hypothetical protein